MSVSEQIIEKLRKNDPSLVELNLGSSAMDNESLKILAKSLEKNTSLKNLELGNNAIDGEGAQILAKVLINNSTIETLYLRGNKIRDIGAKALSEALVQNKALHHLYLGGNEITIEGVKEFAQAFAKNSTLQTIYLRNNAIGDEGAKILAEGLAKNYGLKVLNVANVGLTAAGCRDLIDLLEINTILQSIVFEHNGVEDPEIIQTFANRLKYNASLEVVASNTVAKKILLHCEKYLALEKDLSTKEADFKKLALDCALTRAEQYHWSGNNLQGNAILCAAFLARMIGGKYSDKVAADEVLRVLHLFYKNFLARAKQDLENAKTVKPSQKILQAAVGIVG